MEENSNSVYSLLTKLSEKFASRLNGSQIKNAKRLKRKCYEILLSKCDREIKPREACLEGNADPFCHLLTWEFDLITKHNRRKHAEKLHDCAKKLEEFYSSDNETFNFILYLLLQLRRVPEGDDSIMERNIRSTGRFQSDIIQPAYQISSSIFSEFNESAFKLPSAISCCDSKYSDESFRLKPQKSGDRLADGKTFSVCVLYKQKTRDFIQCPSQKSGLDVEIGASDEGYNSPTKNAGMDVDIWEIASKADFVDSRIWESFGKPFPEKERPFLSELGERANLWTEYVVALKNSMIFDKVAPKVKIVDRKNFTRDVKYMLVGIVSKTFTLNKEDSFVLNTEIAMSGLTSSSLKGYIEDLKFCGSCYRALTTFVTPYECVGQHKTRGYIFAELCESVKRYLSFYRYVILSLPDNVNLLSLHNRVRKLKEQLDTLTSLCKVGFHRKTGEEVPQGARLLNYIYKRILSTTNQNVLMILYSLLYPCCQVYFSRYLQQWILEGTLSDPHDEFFVKPNFKYISTRGRTFWTRSYIIQEETVPEFLSNIKNDILSCGKAMSLLRMSVPGSPLQLYLMSKKTSLISCCFTSEQLLNLEQNTARYNLEACAACSPLFSLEDEIRESREQNPAFFEVIAKKKLATIRRLELERVKKLQEEMERKGEAMALLKEQYDIAVQQKQQRIVKDIERDIAYAEKDLEIEKLRSKLLEEEARSLIAYYAELSEISAKRYRKIAEHNRHLKVQLSSPRTEETVGTIPPPSPRMENPIPDPAPTEVTSISTDDFRSLSKSVSAETFSTAMETSESECTTVDENASTEIHTSKSLDVINANLLDEQQQRQSEINENFLMAQENFKAALRNRAKVMSLELGIEVKNVPKARTKYGLHDDGILTEAQRNRLRVMSSEFGIEIGDDVCRKSHEGAKKTQLQMNKDRMMASNECFYSRACDNANFINQNVEAETERKPKALTLDLTIEQPPVRQTQVNMNVAFEITKPTPMSVDSTPLSEPASTPSTSKFWQFMAQNEAPSTAATNFTDEGFDFSATNQEHVPCSREKSSGHSIAPRKSKRVTLQEAERAHANCLHLFLQRSVSVPLAVHTKLVNRELLKFFVQDLQYVRHLLSLRDYFFLQDGEFGRNITEGLFEKLYDVNFPIDLINFRTLQLLVHKALNSSSKCQGNSDCLSFKINNLPKRFDLGDLNVLDCLSLSYRVEWPLNILLPADTVAKYDEVFKYLLKLHRVSWVQKKIFQELKILSEQVGRNQMYLMSSPQYRRIHQCRHVMTHFIQTFQNYIVGEVLQSNWEIFNRNLANVTDLDQLYTVHTTYIKSILFMCLLNNKAAPIRRVLEKIFVVILKFYDYLRSQLWTLEDGHYVHPNFNKLENIFQNFEEFVMYMFKVGRKVVKSGYQPYLVQLLDMLDLNGYYDKKNNAVSSC